MTIRILSFPECPNAQPAAQLVEEVVSTIGLRARVESIHVGSAEEAEAYRFLGSPTIQIDGQDIEQARRSDESSFGCRIYQIDGRRTGIPSRQMLLDSIQEASESGK